MSAIESSSTSYAAILDDEFSASYPNEDYTILRALKRLHPGEHTRHVTLIDQSNLSFPLSAFLLSRGVTVQIAPDPKHEVVAWNVQAKASSTAMKKGELVTRLLTGALKFTYEGIDFLVYKCSWYRANTCQTILFDIVYEDLDPSRASGVVSSTGHKLVSDVFRWAGSLKDEMWVFQDGVWTKDKMLWNAIRDASWDDLVLDETFLENLRRDTRTFFEKRQTYKDLGIVWKRGILLLGPPGNGKTESIKVLLNESGQTALYVKSFTTRLGPEHGVRQIFDHARANSPCILVIEDLDSLVTKNVRSLFLNELDGLAQNEGILTIATTNHPERIDDAILNRPSRFDVKYTFSLPTGELRKAYTLKWIQKLNSLRQGEKLAIEFATPDSELAEEVAKGTDGWSFAFLKELFVSFLLRVAHDRSRAGASVKEREGSTSGADAILMDQIASLPSQIIVVGKSDGDESMTADSMHVTQPRIIHHLGGNLGLGGGASWHPGSNF